MAVLLVSQGSVPIPTTNNPEADAKGFRPSRLDAYRLWVESNMYVDIAMANEYESLIAPV